MDRRAKWNPGRQETIEGGGGSVEGGFFTDQIGVPAEVTAPQTITDYHHRWPARAIFFGEEASTDGGTHAEDSKETLGDLQTPHSLGLGSPRKIEAGVDSGVAECCVKCLAVILPVLEDQRRDCVAIVVPEQPGAAHQPFGLRIRK